MPFGLYCGLLTVGAFNRRVPLFNGSLTNESGGRCAGWWKGLEFLVIGSCGESVSPFGSLVLHAAAVAGAHPRRAASHRLSGSGDAGFRSLTSPAGGG
jgi:hypothetical protein